MEEPDDKYYVGVSNTQIAAVAGGSLGYGLREPYALGFILFYKNLSLLLLFSLGLSQTWVFSARNSSSINPWQRRCCQVMRPRFAAVLQGDWLIKCVFYFASLTQFVQRFHRRHADGE